MFLRSLLLWLALALPGFAQGLPAPQSDTVNDFAQILPEDDKARIVDTLLAKRKETGVHVTVVTMDTIANYGGEGQRIEDYAKSLFNHWGVGSADLNDGILILVAVEDREMRIALGAGYDVMWDNASQRVIDRDILPAFREDRYVEGIEAGVRGTYKTIVGPHRAGQPAPEPVEETDFAGLIIFAVVAGLVGFLLLRHKVGNFIQRFKHCPSCGIRGLRRTRRVLAAATTSMEGQAELHTFCRACPYSAIELRTIPQSSNDSDSGGGFGGGSSSGGGATGRW